MSTKTSAAQKILPFAGAKGGSGGSTQYTRTPDSLRSKDTVEVLLGLGEGRWKGLRTLQDFFVGDTPLLNASNEANFKYTKFEFKPGDANPGPTAFLLGGNSQNGSVNTNLVQNTSVTRTTPIGPFDYIDLRLNFGQLYKQDDNGVYQASGELKIEYKPSASPTWNLAFGQNIVITGKTTSAYIKELRLYVGNVGTGSYDVRITRISQNSNTDYFFTVSWDSFQVIKGNTFEYKNLATVQFVAEASDQFASIPEFWGVYDGMEVNVPAAYHYNAAARTYQNNIWQGDFQKTYCNSGPWIIYDFASNNRYGVSSYYPLTVDKSDCYEAARWCDELVPDGSGGFHPRWSFNSLISDARNGKDMLRYIAGTFNGVAFDDQNGTVHLRVDKDDPAVALFTQENVVDGRFDYGFTDITSRYNDVTVSFTNPDLDWEEDRRRVFDQAHIDKHGRIPLEFIAVGCTHPQESLRRAYYKLITATTEVMSTKFRTNRLGLFVQPFNVILVADPDLGYGLSGRLQTIAANRLSATLRDPIYLESGVSYDCQFQVPNSAYPATSDDPFQVIKRTVVIGTTGSVTSLTFTAALPANLPEFANFSLSTPDGTTTGLPKPFRVMNIDEIDGDPDNVEIIAVEINRKKWEAVDKVTLAGTVKYSFLPSAANPPPPTALNFTERSSKAKAQFTLILSPVWDFTKYKYYSGRFEAWSRPYVGGKGVGQFERRVLHDNDTIIDHPIGDHEFRILPISTAGVTGPLDTAPGWLYNVGNPANPPHDPINGRIEGNTFFKWDYDDEPVDFLGFQVMYHTNPDIYTWETGFLADTGLITETEIKLDRLPPSARVLMVKAMDTLGIVSVGHTFAVLNAGDVDPQNVLVDFDLKTAGFPGVITNGVINGTTGDLEATSNGVLGPFWSTDPNTLMYSGDAENFYSSSYEEMTYVHTYTAPNTGGYLTLNMDVNAQLVRYFIQKVSAPAWADYRELAGAPWLEPNATYLIKVVCAAGMQGQIHEMKLIVDVPDKRERKSNVAILATTGTRISLSKAYNTITQVSVTMQDDAGTATRLKVIDKDPVAGPLIKCFDDLGVAVAGTVDVRIYGY